MSGCKRGCNTSELLPAFVACTQARGTEESRITAAIKRLCNYAEESKKLLCEIGFKEMQGLVHYLYSLEDGNYTAEDSDQEIHLVRLFYDYLVRRGCVGGNPVILLKEAALKELMGRMEKHGYRSGKVMEEGKDE